tara:strand:+ start:481 stop:708 length:228 start_codon:yes stop_codon:yes gene_type:complete
LIPLVLLAQNNQGTFLGCGTEIGSEEYTLGQSLYLKTEIIEGSFSIDVRNYPDGIYYVKLESTTGTFNKKLILKK